VIAVFTKVVPVPTVSIPFSAGQRLKVNLSLVLMIKKILVSIPFSAGALAVQAGLIGVRMPAWQG